MTQALQVSFRELIPNEGLVGLAAARYRRFGGALPGPSQCTVSLETHGRRERRFTLAQVRLECRGAPHAQAEAAHTDPFTALEQALAALEAQLAGPN